MEDYEKWESLSAMQLSDDGKWVSYRMSRENISDSVWIRNIQSDFRKAFTNVSSWHFIGENYFIAKQGNILLIFDLKKQVEILKKDVVEYYHTIQGNWFIFLTENGVTEITNLKNNRLTIKNVKHIKWNGSHSSALIYSSTNQFNSIEYVNLKKNIQRKKLDTDEGVHWSFLEWHSNGESWMGIGSKDNKKVLQYFNVNKNEGRIIHEGSDFFPKGFTIDKFHASGKLISNDEKHVFFGLKLKTVTDTILEKNTVEIWNAKDQIVYPNRMLINSVKNPIYLAAWNLEKDTIIQITNTHETWVTLSGNQKYAITSNPRQYEPQYKFIGDRDYYHLDLETGNKQLLLKRHSGFPAQLNLSPSGRYICYYTNNNWWLLDYSTGVNSNLTEKINTQWDNSIVDSGTELKVWGMAGWSTHEKSIILYDSHDIWEISIQSSKKTRWTKGKENNMIYRLYHSPSIKKEPNNYNLPGSTTIDLKQKQIIHGFDLNTGASGYFFKDVKNKLEAIIWEKADISSLKTSRSFDTIAYIKQRYDLPPTIIIKSRNEGVVKIESNAHHKEFYWGTSEMIHYRDANGNNSNGILYYPANFDSSQKYPMVVYIYESLSRGIHKYINPSLYNGIGFNITNLVSQGYFVLLPDIAFQKGSPGLSAVNSVTAAINKVKEKGYINPHKIGLYGHSFGSYEANFIITQTNVFAAAISGSGVSDPIGHYFTFNTHYNSIDGWRYENQQYRMGHSFYENKQNFLHNSPLFNAENISTPLLNWAGKLDDNVKPTQSVALYAALRRLQKEHIMLVYKEEGHILFKSENQKDLTLKMQEWWDFYLKNGIKQDWMKTDWEK